MLRQIHKGLLEFAAKEVFHAMRGKTLRGERGVQTISAEMSLRIHPAQRFQQLKNQPRGRMHRRIESDQAGFAHRSFIQWIARNVQAGDLVPALTQPRRGRGQTKGLPAHLVR